MMCCGASASTRWIGTLSSKRSSFACHRKTTRGCFRPSWYGRGSEICFATTRRSTPSHSSRRRGTAQLHVGAHREHLIRRNLEERRRPQRIARHEREQPLAPHRHARPVRRNQRLAAEEERRPLEGDAQAVRLACCQNLVDVGILHEPVARHHAVEPFPTPLHRYALLAAHMWHVLGHHGEKDNLLVQYLVVREVEHQRGWRAGGAAEHEYRRP